MENICPRASIDLENREKGYDEEKNNACIHISNDVPMCYIM